MKLEINKVTDSEINKIKKTLTANDTVEISMNFLSREDEEKINQLLIAFLDAFDQSHLMSYLSYCTLELLTNANKANVKRVYFHEKKLNIFDENDYQDGMLTFNTEFTVNKPHYYDLLIQEKIDMKLSLSIVNNEIIIDVTNKAEMTDTEITRINEKLDKAKIYNSMEEALSDIDRTEGCGLGIIIIVLMLKQLGLSRENLHFKTQDGFTTVALNIPVNAIELI